MNSPYETPNSELVDNDSREEYIKLLGITLKKNTYILVQTAIIISCIIIGVACKFFIKTTILSYQSSSIGLVVLILIPVEIVETFYALKKKTFFK